MKGADFRQGLESARAISPGRLRFWNLSGLADPKLDAVELKKLGKALLQSEYEYKPLRVALLYAHTPDLLREALHTHLLACGYRCEWSIPEYSTSTQAVLDEKSELYRFRPEVVLLAHHYRDVWPGELLLGDYEKFQPLLTSTLSRIAHVIQTLSKNTGSIIICNDFDPPPHLPLGHLETSHPQSISSYYRSLNLELADLPPPSPILHSLESLAAQVGSGRWHDPRYFQQAKIHPSPECVGIYAHSLARCVTGALGQSRKCIVLDLDNTLWGGIVGEDGIENLRLAVGDPVGEACVDFQQYLLGLQRRGILLAVASKNDEGLAREVFQRHPEMPLKLDDFACFRANWNDKVSNIKDIARELSLGLDSLVFIDDQPVEREMVRKFIPEVFVVEIDSDPSTYVQTLAEKRLFECPSLSREDRERTRMLRAETGRRELAATTDLAGYFRDLRMVACITPLDQQQLPRAVQLINKTNQFNLCTRRCSESEMGQRIQHKAWLVHTASLKDRFSELGMVALISASLKDNSAVIDNFLMSCRVLQRGLELALFNTFAAECVRQGVSTIHAEYIATPRNGLVKDLLPSLGFVPISGGRHELALGNYKPLDHFIEIIDRHG